MKYKKLIADIIESSKHFSENKRFSLKYNPFIQQNFHKLVERTSYMKTENIHEIFFHISNDITEAPHCPVCGKKPKFKGRYLTGKYDVTCSKQCGNQYKKFAEARGKKAHKTKLSNIDEFGRNSYDRLIADVQKKIHTPDENGVTPFQKGIKKRKETMKEIVTPDGKTRLDILQEKTKKGLYAIGDDGLNAVERERQRRLQNIDEDGNNFFQRNAIKCAETKYQTIDPETGLNTFQLTAKKASETKCNTIDPETGLNTHQLVGLRSSTLQRSREYKIKHGFTLPEQLDEKELYYNRVWYLTEKEYKKSFNYINPLNVQRGSYGTEGTHQLDHKYSILEGFKNGVLPEIIASKYNLEMLTIDENNSKGAKCSISLDELTTLVYGKN